MKDSNKPNLLGQNIQQSIYHTNTNKLLSIYIKPSSMNVWNRTGQLERVGFLYNRKGFNSLNCQKGPHTLICPHCFIHHLSSLPSIMNISQYILINFAHAFTAIKSVEKCWILFQLGPDFHHLLNMDGEILCRRYSSLHPIHKI